MNERVLTTQQKALALHALGVGFQIRLREDGVWYISLRAEIKRGVMLSSALGDGVTPEAAIESCWAACVTNLKSGEYLVLNATDAAARRAVRWNGFMWQEIIEP